MRRSRQHAFNQPGVTAWRSRCILHLCKRACESSRNQCSQSAQKQQAWFRSACCHVRFAPLHAWNHRLARIDSAPQSQHVMICELHAIYGTMLTTSFQTCKESPRPCCTTAAAWLQVRTTDALQHPALASLLAPERPPMLPYPACSAAVPARTCVVEHRLESEKTFVMYELRCTSSDTRDTVTAADSANVAFTGSRS